MDARSYWLGVATPFVAAAALFLAFVVWLRVAVALHRAGYFFHARWRRDLDRISDYTLQRDIWWERAFGPIFVGGWYYEEPAYLAPARARFNRWIGFGGREGPHIMVGRSRDLGEVDA